jgi:hypothetical protein
MGKSLTDVAKEILMNEGVSNQATLKPGSANPEPRPQNPIEAEDLGPALVEPTGTAPTSKAAARIAKVAKRPADKDGGEKTSKEVMEEDINLDEEEQLDEISSELAGRAAFVAKNRAETAENQGKNKLAKALEKQSNRLYDAAERKANKENNSDEGISSGKKAKMRKEDVELEEEIEISEELAAFIEEKLAEGLTEEEIAMAIDENFEFVTEESEAEEVVAEETEEEYQVDMSEHVEALFAGEELSEDFKQKALTIFESAVKQKVQEELKIIEEAYAETLEEQIAQIQEELTENVDDYLNYVVEQWVSDNEVAITEGLRTELTEDFISGLRNLFAEHYIDIPEDKVSVVEEMTSQVASLEEKLNEEIERNVQLTKALNESAQYEILADACDGLTATQTEKLKSLAEGINYTTANEYAQKINILRESYFTNKVVAENVLDNEEVDTEATQINEQLTGPMAAYVKTLGKHLPK